MEMCDKWVGTVTAHHNAVVYHFHQYSLTRLGRKGNTICKLSGLL